MDNNEKSSPKSKTVELTFFEFFNFMMFIEVSKIFGIFIFAYILYYFIPFIFSNISLMFSQYVVSLSLLGLFKTWYDRDGIATFLLHSLSYLIILCLTYFFWM